MSNGTAGTSWAGGGLVAAGLAVVPGLTSPALIRYRPESDGADDR
ncbi:hypothetical protein [Actinoplanes utahensis]|nr:hypothetical protein [Actinoplanes utahensis]